MADNSADENKNHTPLGLKPTVKSLILWDRRVKETTCGRFINTAKASPARGPKLGTLDKWTVGASHERIFIYFQSVSEGHPDKVADQISDAILDAILAQDKHSRVAAETLCNTGLVVLAGEITTNANVDYIQIARDTLKRIGYDNSDYGIDYKGCAVLVAYDKQSPDIAQGVNAVYDDGPAKVRVTKV